MDDTLKIWLKLFSVITIFTIIDYLFHTILPLGVPLLTLNENDYFVRKMFFGTLIIIILYYFRNRIPFLQPVTTLSLTGVLLQFRYAYTYSLQFTIAYGIIHFVILYAILYSFEKLKIVSLQRNN